MNSQVIFYTLGVQLGALGICKIDIRIILHCINWRALHFDYLQDMLQFSFIQFKKEKEWSNIMPERNANSLFFNTYLGIFWA